MAKVVGEGLVEFTIPNPLVATEFKPVGEASVKIDFMVEIDDLTIDMRGLGKKIKIKKFLLRGIHGIMRPVLDPATGNVVMYEIDTADEPTVVGG